MNSASYNKYKRPKQKTRATTNPGSSRTRNGRSVCGKQTTEPVCPLLAKDSEWVDGSTLQPPTESPESTSDVLDEEEVLQLSHAYHCTRHAHCDSAPGFQAPPAFQLFLRQVECEDGLQMKPLAIMFPDLLEKDPQTLQGVLNRVMSTTEVTRHLVNLGQKANFTFMKKANRLIPPDKQWMESLTENSSSICSVNSAAVSNSTPRDYEEDCDNTNYGRQSLLKKNNSISGNIKQSQQESNARDVKEKDRTQ